MKSPLRSLLLPAGVLLVLATFAFTASAMQQGSAQQSSAQQGSGQGSGNGGWQHLALPHDGTDLDRKLSQTINRLGNEGWQLVCVTSVVGNGNTVKMVYFFKREKN